MMTIDTTDMCSHLQRKLFEEDGIYHSLWLATGFESSWRMKEFTDEKGIPFWEISKEGETINLKTILIS